MSQNKCYQRTPRRLVNEETFNSVGAEIRQIPADDQEEIAASLLAYVAANLPDHPIYFTERDNALREAGYSLSPARIGPARLVKIREE